MKKIITLALAVLMIFAMSVSAFAAPVIDNRQDEDADNYEGTNNVTVTLPSDEGVTTIKKIYYVVVDWESLAFSYTFDVTPGTEVVWDPLTHTYKAEDNPVEGQWSEGKQITVYNHSNDEVTVTGQYAAGADENGLTVSLDKTTFDLDIALENDAGNAVAETDTTLTDYDAFTVTVSGTPLDMTKHELTIGTVTVRIAPKA